MPYIFLNDTPVKHAVAFPNQFLSAQLGLLLMKFRPAALDVIESTLRSDKPFELMDSSRLPEAYRDVAKALNQERLKGLIDKAVTDQAATSTVAQGLADLLEQGLTDTVRNEFATRSKDLEIAGLREELGKERKLRAKTAEELKKFQRTERYIRRQERRKRK